MSENIDAIEKDDFPKLNGLPSPPVKRAAYSDRTAWLMCIMSELAYVRFEHTDQTYAMRLAEELAGLDDSETIRNKLQALKRFWETERADGEARLTAVLQAGKFELLRVFARNDTEAFLARRRPEGRDPGMAVLAFRGTTSFFDWQTNIKAMRQTITKHGTPSKDPEAPGLHTGFLQAFKQVEDDIRASLDEVADLPLYLTGHSLGGALAVTATWLIDAKYNAACYTFGSPRVGDNSLANRFKTPIYRIVNGPDPVPFMPPSAFTAKVLKALLRFQPFRFPGYRWLEQKFIAMQGYRHFGYLRYLKRDKAEFLSEVGNASRLLRTIWRVRELRMLAHYHKIALYREKLRTIALKRNE